MVWGCFFVKELRIIKYKGFIDFYGVIGVGVMCYRIEYISYVIKLLNIFL